MNFFVERGCIEKRCQHGITSTTMASGCDSRYRCVVNLPVLFLLIAGLGFSDDCLPYNQPVTIRGKLTLRDESGYRQWIALTPERPICTMEHPNPFNLARAGVTELQAEAAGNNSKRWDRLDRLIGHRVVVTGQLFGAQTGYHRTDVLIDVVEVQPVNAAGQAALQRPKPRLVIKEVAAYDVLIVAGQRLTKEAREVGTNKLLMPTDAYAPHRMNGADVLYVNCREGYKIESSNVDPPDVGMCGVIDNTCGMSVEDKDRAPRLKMRCVKTATPVAKN